MRLTKKIGFYDFFVFKCPSEGYKKWQLHMNTLYLLHPSFCYVTLGYVSLEPQ